MTPKEKADELVDKFCEYSHTEFIPYKGGYQKDSQIKNAKQCALIAVDEIIPIIDPETNFKTWEFYKQVKQEIEKL
jgi:hypothetical protein